MENPLEKERSGEGPNAGPTSWTSDASGLRDVIVSLDQSVKAMAALYLTPQFLRFLAVGGVAALLHWLARLAFSTALPFDAAVYSAYAVGIAVGFALNRVFVFPYSTRTVAQEAAWFVVINLISFPVVAGLAIVLGEWLLPRWMPVGYAHAVGHGLAVLAPTFLNFALHKFVTFRGG
ncbi:MAG: GtrA family protein [Hyphomonadaceae bacterium]|nr:GtrA family protein [Hyphomonadaceae bacterium]